ncbi:MAG: S8 family serine peptidase [Dehalobacterium sp.]
MIFFCTYRYFKRFDNKTEIYDDHGHGTFVTGIIAADGRMKGIAPNCNLVILGKSEKAIEMILNQLKI